MSDIWGGAHTCHEDCPCHEGKEPTPDFLGDGGFASGVTTNAPVHPITGEDENRVVPDYIQKGHCVRFGECTYCNASLWPERDGGRIKDACPGPFETADDDGWTEVGAVTDQSQEAVSRPSNEPPVDPVLVSLCVERAAREVGAPYYGQSLEPTFEETVESFEPIVRAVAPSLLEAGAKAERERLAPLIEFAEWANVEGDSWEFVEDDLNERVRAALASITEEGKREDA